MQKRYDHSVSKETVMSPGESDMDVNPVFLTAFWAGMTAPVSLYATPPSYMAYIVPASTYQSFLLAGARIGSAYEEVEAALEHDRQV